MRLVDRIAYINHDIDDALRAGVLRRERPARARRSRSSATTGSERIDLLVHDLVEHSERAGDIVQGEEVGGAMARLRKFMFEQRLPRRGARAASRSASTGVIETLFDHYLAHPERSCRSRRRRATTSPPASPTTSPA